jgi:hypothetical protein
MEHRGNARRPRRTCGITEIDEDRTAGRAIVRRNFTVFRDEHWILQVDPIATSSPHFENTRRAATITRNHSAIVARFAGLFFSIATNRVDLTNVITPVAELHIAVVACFKRIEHAIAA